MTDPMSPTPQPETLAGGALLVAIALALAALKLAGVVAWPWCWVLCPIWAPALLVVSGVGAILILACLIAPFA